MAVAPRNSDGQFSGPAVRLDRLRAELRGIIEHALGPLIRLLAALGVQPNQITVAGVVISVAAAALVLSGHLLAAGLVWLLGSSFDLLDGALARHENTATSGGAFLDSTLDRVTEGALFAAVAYHFAALGDPLTAAVSVLGLLGSFLISYTRARAEALGAECKVGLVTRAERVVLLGAGLCSGLLEPALYILLALTAVTVAQRIRHGLEALR